jgi:glycosyltransferase involved in cell wall biosynthesis
MNPRLVIVNPHMYHFGKLVAYVFNRKPNYQRYKYLMELNNNDIEVAFLFLGKRTSFRRPMLRFLFTHILNRIEILSWAIINRKFPWKYRMLFSTSQLLKNQDLLFYFAVEINHLHPNLIVSLQSFNGISMIHLSHYYQETTAISDAVQKMRFPVLIREGCLEGNDFYEAFFSEQIQTYLLPVPVAEKFQNLEPLELRSSKCLALGTLIEVSDRGFLNFYNGASNLQPMRRTIYENRSSAQNEIVCRIKLLNLQSPSKMPVKNYLKKFSRLSRSKAVTKMVLPKKHFDFDIVEEYNKHMMFVSPEEVIGLPSANYLEGMAAGAVYLGADIRTYREMGLISGYHYVHYTKGDYEDLIGEIRKLQGHPGVLKDIGERGSKFVQNNFTADKVKLIFSHDMRIMLQKLNSGSEWAIKSSFIR